MNTDFSMNTSAAVQSPRRSGPDSSLALMVILIGFCQSELDACLNT
jgi:hypothetical protein